LEPETSPTMEDRESVDDEETAVLLSGARVLDLTGAIGAYCSKLLADLGADVVKVEPPAGDELRRRPPFDECADGRGQSLVFAAYHANKRGITLDVTRSEAMPVLSALGRQCDIVLVSPGPRSPVTGFDRDVPSLSWAAPAAIVASITPFGLTGPWRDMRMTAFLSYAMGGQMHWVGEKDGPPLAVPGQLAWDDAGIHAALGIAAAMLVRDQVGGQLLDLSVHEVAAAKDFLLERYDVDRPDEWGRSVGVGIPPTGEWMCADGPLAIAAHQEHHWQAFLAMLDHPDELSDQSFADPLFRREICDALEALIAPLMAGRKRSELFEKGQAAGLPCAPFNTPADFVADLQPQVREVFVTLPATGAGGPVRIPWRWCHSTGPLLRLRRPAPSLGEHNHEVFVDELGFSVHQVQAWKQHAIV
jgi:crotonobetainyl-CoA:carnitine CoA-transferase CaiB-like acyl-CoA transferase